MNGINAYLYVIRDDNTLGVHEGKFYSGTYGWSRARFEPTNGHWCYVSNEPGDPYWRKMWLPERDDQKAANIFIEYHERKIKNAEQSIESHRQAIAVLKGENNESISLG